MRALVLAIAIALVLGFTWEGKLDPNDFDSWEVIKMVPGPSFVTLIVKNPVISSIEKVALLVKKPGTLIAYRYFENGRPYSFTLDLEQDKYVEHKFTQEEAQSCMECHQDEVVKDI